MRLQCYEGLDEAKALYEWDYAKQMLYTQLLRDAVATQTAGAASLAEAADRVAGADAAFFSRRFLRRAAAACTRSRASSPSSCSSTRSTAPIPEFEAFLLEVLAERQVTIPELGTIRAKTAPLFVLTSNGTREMTDALRRRCLHAFVDYPPPSREQAILELRVPGLGQGAGGAARGLRAAASARLDLRKAPSIAETIDWARALVMLGASALDPELARVDARRHPQARGRPPKVEAKLGHAASS